MILQVSNLSKSFDGLRVLNDLSLEIEENTLVGIVGPNGAGKTTLLNVTTGFMEPDSGKVLFKKREITKMPAHRIVSTGISRTFQNLRLAYNLTVLDNVLLACPRQKGERILNAIFLGEWRKEEKPNRNKAEEVLWFVGLTDWKDEKARNLSYGQQKLLALGCSLATDSDLMILDEPVAGIAPEMRSAILKKMQELIELGKTVIFIEHDIEAVKEVAHRVIVLDEGQVVGDGKPGKVLTDPKIVEHYLA